MKLVIATPVDGDATTGQCAMGYATRLANLYRDNGAMLGMVPTHLGYSYDICRARNRIAAMVLRDMTDATHVLWWDSDVVPTDLRVIGRMLATGHHVIACPYPRKRHPLTWTHVEGGGAVIGSCVEVAAVPFGFTITSIECLREMTDTFDEEAYMDVRSDGSRCTVTGIFNLSYSTMGPTRTLLSEDYSFCQRWRDIGGKVHLYTGEGNVMKHIGLHAYGGLT